MENCGSDHGKCCCPSYAKQEKCHDGEHHHEDAMKAHYFLKLADEAWHEVLKDKIKEYILETQNDHMIKLAKIIAEGNHHRWKNKMDKKEGCENFKKELYDFFIHSKK